VADIPRIDGQVSNLVIASQGHGSKIQGMDSDMILMNNKLMNMNDQLTKNIAIVEDKVRELDEYSHRPVDYYARIEDMGNLVRRGLTGEMDKLMT